MRYTVRPEAAARSPGEGGSSSEGVSPRVRVRAGAILISGLLLLAALDIALGWVGLRPPEHYDFVDWDRHEESLTPFVETSPGVLSIGKAWLAGGDDRLRVRPGKGEGEYYLLPGFRDARIPMPKPQGTLRIFVLGGSTVFGLYVGDMAAFPKRLEQELRDRLDQEVNVINLGAPGLSSSRVAGLQERVLRLDPDLIIVYTGHNELLGGGTPAPGWIVDVRQLLVSRSTFVAWLDYLLLATTRSFTELSEADARRRAREARVRDVTSVARAERAAVEAGDLERARREYERALGTMVGRARAAGVSQLFLLPVANLVYPPVPGPGPADAASARADSLAREANAAVRGARHAEALGLIDRAAELALGDATIRYQRGLALLYFGRTEAGIAELERARDLDAQQHRISSELEAAFVDAMTQWGGTWLDLRGNFRTRAALVRSEQLFIDHVHPTALGHQRLADAILPAVVELLEGRERAGPSGVLARSPAEPIQRLERPATETRFGDPDLVASAPLEWPGA